MLNCVILCGGSGSRLWPLSREKFPKQLLNLTNEMSMLQNTVIRSNKINCDRIIIISNKEHSFIIEKQIKELDLDTSNIHIICEPLGRDSAAAVCISALIGEIEDYSIVMPSDHVMDDNQFVICCNKAITELDHSIVTFGIKPTRVETGYGYIQVDEYGNTQQFVEKPKYEIAKQYFESGNYLWNAGLFAFKNKNMIYCFEKYATDILDICEQTIKNTISNDMIINLDKSFINCRSISLDYAIIEPLCKDTDINIDRLTIPFCGYWNDIGSYESLYDENIRTVSHSDGNVIKGDDIITINSTNCYIQSESIVATIGVNNLVIVHTNDAILVCNKNNTQEVKKVFEHLKSQKRTETIIHKKAFRPWGWYINIEGHDTSKFKVKHIAVYPGKRLSLQSHNYRSEHWVIVSGNAIVQIGKDILPLSTNQHIYIPRETLHRVENVGDDLLEFTETQIGDYLGEDDIIRFEDDFGRV